MHQASVRIGPYEIVSELAAGGMATTFIACKRGDSFFERLVVLKRIHPWLLQDPKSGDMLRDEARLAGSIQHPHVVHVEDVINHDGEVCLVMPYVESLSLGALLKFVRQAGERIPSSIASRILIDVLAGLHAAHEAKDLRGEPLDIVHRDVSPNNILVGTDGQSRIIDFGIARATSRLCQTSSRDMKGTIAYMSPEQLRRRELDRRADVFAAGAVLYEMLTGERLFDGHDEADILIGVLADEVPSICNQCPEVGPDVDAVLARALARERDERFPSARAFADALEAALAPASPPDVGVWVARFGRDEFTRRQSTIRAVFERQDSEVSSLGAQSETPPPSVSIPPPSASMMKPTYRRDNWKIIVGVVGLMAMGWITARKKSDPSSDIRHMVVREAPALLSASKYMQNVASTTRPIAGPSQQSAAPATRASSEALPAKSVVVRPPLPPIRLVLPPREKVDNEPASELQENPYR